MSRFRTSACVAGVTAMLAATIAAPPALAVVPSEVQPLSQCIATNGSERGCYEMSIVPSVSGNAIVRITRDLNTTAENYDNSLWRGGVGMQRWPVAGQWKQYPKTGDQGQGYPAGKSIDTCGAQLNEAGCVATFTGPRGSTDLVFTPKDAGWVYETQTKDSICTPDRSACDISGSGVQSTSYAYIFVLKASKYRNAKGKWVVTRTCPRAELRKSACQPAAMPLLARAIGGGSPVDVSWASVGR